MQLMSIEDLAAYLGDSKRTIYKYIASGDCPPYIRITAKNIKFDRADVDAWLESKKVYTGSRVKKKSGHKVNSSAREMKKNVIRSRKLPWTPRAQAVFKTAEKMARKEGFDIIGTEHVFYGILSVKDCLGAVIINNLSADAARCFELYEQLCRPSGENSAVRAELSEDIDNVIQCAYKQATEWGHEYIGAEHLLVGIILAGKGMGFQILAELGITLEQVRQEAMKLVVCRVSKEERYTK